MKGFGDNKNINSDKNNRVKKNKEFFLKNKLDLAKNLADAYHLSTNNRLRDQNKEFNKLHINKMILILQFTF